MDEINSSTDTYKFVLLDSIPLRRDSGLRFYNNSGTSEHNGEKIELNTDLGCGINVQYRGVRYRVSPEDIIAAVIDAVDGTTKGI